MAWCAHERKSCKHNYLAIKYDDIRSWSISASRLSVRFSTIRWWWYYQRVVLCCWLWLNRLKFILPLRALFNKLSYFHCRCFVENFAKFVCRSFVHSSFAAYDFKMNVRCTVYNQHWMQSPSILHTSKSKKNTQNERDEENKTKRRNNTLQWYLCSTHSEQHEIDIVGHEAYARLIIQYNALRI